MKTFPHVNNVHTELFFSLERKRSPELEKGKLARFYNNIETKVNGVSTSSVFLQSFDNARWDTPVWPATSKYPEATMAQSLSPYTGQARVTVLSATSATSEGMPARSMRGKAANV